MLSAADMTARDTTHAGKMAALLQKAGAGRSLILWDFCGGMHTLHSLAAKDHISIKCLRVSL